ncbi:MAG TPA: hypothetical protein VM243_02635 [Phycisphaerae bacterium]|nr:hypothetical protein [Phycisphaerae bacterium]
MAKTQKSRSVIERGVPALRTSVRRLDEDFGEPTPQMERALAIADECRNDILNETDFETGRGSGIRHGLKATHRLVTLPDGKCIWKPLR